MKRLIAFLTQLARQGFHGAVTIRFKAGQVGVITVNQDYLEDTLPM